MQPSFDAPRHRPVQIAPETFLIQATIGEGTPAPFAVHMNSLLIRGAEPIVVDTGTPIHREQYLEDLFSLVDPADVRWVFVSHEDRDHTGNLEAVMEACPNATLVANWFLCERMSVEPLQVPPTRWRWVNDGESFTAGDRTMVAVRPPLFDSPATRGLFDSSTGVYWGGDCFGAPVKQGTASVAELDPEFWAFGFNLFNQWNSPWAPLVDRTRYAAKVASVQALGVSTIASTHGPHVPATHVARAFELLHGVPDALVDEQPGQPVLDGMVAAMAAAVA